MDDSLAFAKIAKRLGDQWWRLNNLYKIQDAHGQCVQFKPNWAQESLYRNLHYFNVVLKARQLGFSTFILIYLLDSCLFNSNQSAGVIADTRDNAEELFKNKVKFAYDNLPEFIKAKITSTTDSAKKLEFSNGSSIRVGTSLRGGTFQKLHISEYGKIAARYPEKAIEIKTGALNTVHAGQQIFIESTAEGQQGEFFDITERARKLNTLGKELTPLDPKFFFFPWFNHPDYKLSSADADNTSVNADMSDYFKRLSNQGIDLSPGQKAWYVKKHEAMGDQMKREYPSTPEEAFEASLEGAYYTKQMTIVRRNKQITQVPHEPRKPVYTFWDIGKGRDDMAIWFFQHIGNQYRFINYHESSNEGWEYYQRLLASYPYNYVKHYWPHDGGQSVLTGTIKTHKELAQEFGIRPIKIVPRTNDVQADIMNKCRTVLPRCWFDEDNCSVGIKHLDSYRKEWDDKLGVWKDKPRHDQSSHCADAFRTFACGYEGRQEELTDDGSEWINGRFYAPDHCADMDYNMLD